MANVMTVEAINEDIFICGKCKVAYTSLQTYFDHKRDQCNVNQIGPEFIIESNATILGTEEVIINNVDLDTHQLQAFRQDQCLQPQVTANDGVSESTVLACLKCDKQFKKLKSLSLHLKTHNGEKLFQCPICGRCFVQNVHLQRHLLSHKVWPDGANDTTAKSTDVNLLNYACPYCPCVLLNHSQYKIHMKKHCSMKRFRCVQGDCVDLFDGLTPLLQHVENAHLNRSYICHICSKVYHSLEEIAQHQQNHEPQVLVNQTNKKHHCLHCDSSFLSQEKLTLHMITENHQKTCVHCNKVFASDKRLRRHLETHNVNKMHFCNICGEGFRVKKYLTTHMMKHGDRIFACGICKFKFKRKDMLNRHIKTHQSKKKFSCPFKQELRCNLEFSRSDKLNLHIKSHTKRMKFDKSVTKKSASCSIPTMEVVVVSFNSKN